MTDSAIYADSKAEAGVISGIMFKREMPPAALCLSPDDFSVPEHQTAFEALREAHTQGKRPEYLTVERAIGQHAATAIEKISTSNRMSPNHLPEYVSAVIDASVRRKVIARCRQVAEMAMNRNVNQSEILAGLTTEDLGVISLREPKHIKDLVALAKEEIQKPFEQGANEILRCGIANIDNSVGGFSRGNMTTICATPGTGKSAFSINLALAAAKAHGYSSLISSLEDVAMIQTLRIIASEFGLSFNCLRNRTLSAYEIESGFRGDLDVPIYIEDAPYQSPESIRAMAISHKARHGKLDFLFVDHLMEMADESDPTRSTARNVRAIRDIAKELNCHVFLLHQPRKDCPRDKEIEIFHMTESSRVEAVSRCILLLFRDETLPTVLNVNIAKNNNGSKGRFQLNFDGERMQIW
jgi:replicative DNA helicase